MPDGFIRHFHTCNKHDLNKFVSFLVAGNQVGWVGKELAALLLRGTGGFIAAPNGLALTPHLDTFAARSDVLAQAARWIAEHKGQKLRHEMYPVIREWGDEPLAQMDRTAVPWFGVRGFGIHVNGFTRKHGEIHLWVGERAHDRQADPGKLDNMIGGGQPIGLSLEDNLCKEAQEEAGIGAALARTAKPISTLRYRVERQGGLRNDTLFIYDLELPADFTPRNTDGEVAAFHLMSLPEIADIVRTTDRFKFNCNLVIIDFLLRHGFLKPQNAEFDGIQSFLAPRSA